MAGLSFVLAGCGVTPDDLARAACHGTVATADFFAVPPAPAAVAACDRCASVRACLDQALDMGDYADKHGWRAGMSPSERRKLRAARGVGT